MQDKLKATSSPLLAPGTPQTPSGGVPIEVPSSTPVGPPPPAGVSELVPGVGGWEWQPELGTHVWKRADSPVPEVPPAGVSIAVEDVGGWRWNPDEQRHQWVPWSSQAEQTANQVSAPYPRGRAEEINVPPSEQINKTSRGEVTRIEVGKGPQVGERLRNLPPRTEVRVPTFSSPSAPGPRGTEDVPVELTVAGTRRADTNPLLASIQQNQPITVGDLASVLGEPVEATRRRLRELVHIGLVRVHTLGITTKDIFG